jgi:UDP-N-acetylmuramate dehydrogenase
MTELQQQLSRVFPHLPWKFDYILAPLTYLKIGGPAEVFIELADVKEIQQVVKYITKQQFRLTIIGGASNVVISDTGITGVVLKLSLDHFHDLHESTADGLHLIRAGTGIKMATLVANTVTLHLQGLEYFLGVPGTLGGAIYNNAHYLSDLIGEHVLAVHVLDREGSFKWIKHAECQFAYEKSRFQTTKEIILEVDFALAAGNSEESREKIKHATEYRAATQPLGVPSSGCIFQNVPNTPTLQKRFPQFAEKEFVPGGFIIDQAHLKGKRVGGISVSTKHAAWFVNDGTGTSKDVLALIQQVKDQVKNTFDVALHEEIFFLE